VLYDPDWLSLLDARERLKAKGADASEVESAICNALRDRKLKVRVIPEKVIYGPTGATLDPAEVRALEFDEGKFRPEIPDPTPGDIDWDNSRPTRPWAYGPWQHELLAHVARIEVSRADLERVFPMLKGATPLPPKAEAATEAAREENVGSPDDSAPTTPSDQTRGEGQPTGHKRRRKQETKLDRAKRAIAELKSLEVSVAELTDSELHDEVCKRLGKSLGNISQETVRRAAGRRK
jgi:hypothetical protein